MLRLAALALAVSTVGCAGCSKSAGEQDKGTPTPAPAPDKIPVPGAEKVAPPTATGAPQAPDDPKFHLKPDEGTLTTDKCEAKAGSEATVAIKVAPGTGYHVSTDFPIKLTLDPPAGVKLAKNEMTAGKGDKGDAETFSEQALAFAVKATPEKAGSYEIKGTFKFGVCDKDSCHPKRQPITIQCTAI